MPFPYLIQLKKLKKNKKKGKTDEENKSFKIYVYSNYYDIIKICLVKVLY